jgi:hypothetical protein
MEVFTNVRWWSDIMAEEEQRQAERLLRMTAAEWKEEGTRMIRTFRGRDVRPLMAYLNRVDRDRDAFAKKKAEVVVRRRPTAFDIDFALWRDMVEEPWKFGDDICDWLALDEKLSSGPGRWRLEAYWAELQAVEDAKAEALVAPWRALYTKCAKQAAIAGDRAWVQRDIKRHVARFRAEALARTRAATRIQAAVRGHLARAASPFQDCCMCLSHRICPLKTGAGMMCRSCQEQGPYEDITGPIADEWNWFRAEGVDLTRRRA